MPARPLHTMLTAAGRPPRFPTKPWIKYSILHRQLQFELADKTVKRTLRAIKEVSHRGTIVRQLETGSIEVERNGKLVRPVKPELRKLARELNVGLQSEAGNTRNTRQLGRQIIRKLMEGSHAD